MADLRISEIFYSIQGESTFAGLPCVFIRLSGCNLRCNYCDASYTWEETGLRLDTETILKEISAFPCGLVEVTGGEPLVQKECYRLLDSLLLAGKKVLLESNGSIGIDSVPDDVSIILDIKCPDSGSIDSFNKNNIDELRRRTARSPGSCELKFVLSSFDDYKWAVNFINYHQLPSSLPLLFSPVQTRIKAVELAKMIMADGLNVRLQLQLHTILWPDISRGV